MSKPICVDLFCGLGGFSQGFLNEGYQCWGFDIERHDYGQGGYPGDLVLQDILTLHGSQFKDAAVIVASPPCQEYSYMAMPWSRGKQIAGALRGQGEFPTEYRGSRTLPELKALWYACWRIQIEASHAAGRYIPMVIENVRGAQPWVGHSAWHYGSFHLWGDVPTLMPYSETEKMALQNQAESDNIVFSGCFAASGENEERGRNDVRQNSHRPSLFSTEIKNGGDWFGSGENCSLQRRASSKSDSRKAASAQIAKIPLALSTYIARVYKP